MADFMYRIEDEKGNGCYSGKDVYIRGQRLNDAHSWDGGIHPGIDYDYEPELYRFVKNSLGGDVEKYIFGFDTIEQYTNWFTREERKIIFQHGYRLKKVQVRDKVQGRKQCIGIRV